jgi:hypothetical protein
MPTQERRRPRLSSGAVPTQQTRTTTPTASTTKRLNLNYIAFARHFAVRPAVAS